MTRAEPGVCPPVTRPVPSPLPMPFVTLQVSGGLVIAFPYWSATTAVNAAIPSTATVAEGGDTVTCAGAPGVSVTVAVPRTAGFPDNAAVTRPAPTAVAAVKTPPGVIVPTAGSADQTNVAVTAFPHVYRGRAKNGLAAPHRL